MTEWQGWPGWYRAWHPASASGCGQAKPRKLRRVAKGQYKLVSALPGGGFVSVPLGRFDFDFGPPFQRR